ncbi:MAG: toll/interleukin-1 receptor domain-containing protein [Bacteroidaceae bacterium]|nr:toll/interleukin-1 receptor domain-containing protein [Bacteroidaceae bacterium]
MQRKIFISYSRKNLSRVLAIKQEIEEATGVECWIDLEDIETGKSSFTVAIVDAINACPIFLFMLSEDSQVSENANKELDFAYKKQKETTKHVVIIYIEDCKMNDYFTYEYQKVDTIDWDIAEQKEKFLKHLQLWLQEGSDNPLKDDGGTQFLLGNDYYYGINGKPKDYSEAVFLYRLAANEGHREAMFCLGNCYKYGRGVPQDYSKAKDWYENAAQLGHAEAQYNLGRCFKKELGTKKNYSEAFKWFLRSAEQGYVLAQNNVGVCYEQGIGVPVNLAKAIKWYCLADEQGDEFAHEALIRLGAIPE